MPQAFLNKNVFNADLKESTVSDILTSSRRAFHSLGPATEKALSPYFLCMRGSTRRDRCAERKEREGWYSFNIITHLTTTYHSKHHGHQ